MPIFVKDYSWQQTEKHITIKVPLKNVHQKHVDLLTAKRYLKANYYPYIFELFLLSPIDDKNSNCFIKDDEIVFELCKIDPEIWHVLESSISKSEKLELKKKYLEEIQNDTQEAIKEKVKKHHELKRLAVREQIAVDDVFRKKIENIKKEETEKALKDLKLFEECKVPAIKDRPESPERPPKLKKVTPKILPPKHNYKPVKQNNAVIIPQPRKRQSVNIGFTARQFSTPSRESKSQEEEEWLTNQAKARRSAGFVDEDLRPEERNPQWLKDKGDEFFKAKNYLGAISAYSTGIKLSKNYAALYVNRSAAHFAVGNLNKTIDDCSTALELMTPICEANRVLRAKCIARRGAALCKLGYWREGKIEIEAAAKLVPADETLKQDLKNIESKLEPKSEIIHN